MITNLLADIIITYFVNILRTVVSILTLCLLFFNQEGNTSITQAVLSVMRRNCNLLLFGALFQLRTH